MPFIDVQVDAASAVALLQFGAKRLDYSTVNALRTTALAIQAAERAGLARKFTLRNKAFLERQVAIIKPFPSVAQRRFYTTVSVGQKKRLLLPFFEEGSDRRPQRALAGKTEGVAVPVRGGPARPSIQSTIPEALWVSRLGLRRLRPAARGGKRRRARGRPVFEGERHTFLIPGSAIFQRVGRVLRAVYIISQGEPRIDQRLKFIPTAKVVANVVFPRAFDREVTAVFAYRGLRRAA